MKNDRPTTTEKRESHFYAAPKDRSSVVKIEVWRRYTPITQGFGPDTDWEHVTDHVYTFYKTEHNREVLERDDHFVIPALGGAVVYRLSDKEVRKAGLT